MFNIDSTKFNLNYIFSFKLTHVNNNCMDYVYTNMNIYITVEFRNYGLIRVFKCQLNIDQPFTNRLKTYREGSKMTHMYK